MSEIIKETARLRWPGFQITGDGKIAVLLLCCAKIVLCEIPLQAEPIRTADCEQCRRTFGDSQIHHKVVVMNEPTAFYSGQRTAPMPKRIWERDRLPQ